MSRKRYHELRSMTTAQLKRLILRTRMSGDHLPVDELELIREIGAERLEKLGADDEEEKELIGELLLEV